jgi:outer membrane biosynthesis protein TonB
MRVAHLLATIPMGLFAIATACGGAAEPAKTADAPGVSSAARPALGDADPVGTPPSVGPTTTTTDLGDGGDLQGAKLSSSVHTTTETKGDAGPKAGSGHEPGRSVKDIQTIITAHRDEARACYDKGIAAHPGIEGNLDVKWAIDPQGNVTDASVDTTKSDILEPSIGACVLDVVKAIHFAPSAKGFETHAHYPFNFHPKTFTPKAAGK